MLELRAISKSFPGVKALDAVSVRFEEGEIHALVGENGAGKSTLVNIITGICQPDAGEIYYQGERLHFRSYRDSLERGIDIVNQEIQLIPDSTIAENIMLDKMITYGRTGIINWQAVNNTARAAMASIGLPLSPTTIVRSLSAAQKQLVQIAKALASNARMLLLDEPTSSLTDHEAAHLMDLLRELKTKRVTIIFVSHKFEQVFSLCDRVTVLRDGQLVCTKPIEDLTAPALAAMMIGRTVTGGHLGRLDVNRERELLRAEHVSRKHRISDASFTLYEGEILGFYGLVGSGRTELARLLVGEDSMDSGTVHVRGARAHVRSVADGLERYRMGYVTENRKEEGLLLESSVSTNVTITIWPRIIHRLTRYIRRSRELGITWDMIRALDIRSRGPHQMARELSGGNQQKVCIAKMLAADCDVLIIDEPTVGVDIGAKEHIHQLLWNLARHERKGIVLISSDMPEIIRLSSRILVFKNRRIVGEIVDVDHEDRTYEQVSGEIAQYLG